MRELIRKILRESRQSILVYELTLSSNILDERFIRVLGDKSDNMRLLTNYHSETAIGKNSNLQRVDIESIDDTIRDFESEFITFAKKVVQSCKISNNRSCGFLMVDELNGFEFHVWLNYNRINVIEVVINTSIYHPKHLPNRRNDPVLFINKKGNVYFT
jgi:hypothetical protein